MKKNQNSTTTLLLYLLFSVFSVHTVTAGTEPPPGFIENKGQVADDQHRVLTDIQFKAEQPGLNAYFKPDGIIYHLYKSESKTEKEYTTEDWDNYKKGNLAAIGKKVYFFRMDFELIGANTQAQAVKKDPLPVQYNYYLPQCPGGITGVQAYTEIMYTDVYPHIDLRYYYQDNTLKYEFIVRPGGDPSMIRFTYKGSTRTFVDGEELAVENIYNNLKESKPYTYNRETHTEVSNRFMVNEEGVVSFNIGDYDASSTLVIDPAITWATYYNNNYSSDFHCNSAIDANGKIYSAFATYGTTWPTVNAGSGQYYDATRDGITDLIILGFNANYSVQWVTYYGGNDGDYLCGTGGDYGKTIGVDQNNYVYVGGYTVYAASPVFPTQSSGAPGAFYQDQTHVYGGNNPFLLKFDGNGVRQWATIFNHEQANTNSAGMEIKGICVSGTKVYFTGATYKFNSNDIPLRNLAGAYYQPTFLGGMDPFIGRFNDNCVLEWSTYFNSGSVGVTAYKDGADVSVDASGNLLFAGHFSSGTVGSAYLLNPGGGAYYQGTNAGSTDIYIAKFNTSLQPVWATFYGGNDLDRVSQVSSDGSGNILVACRTVNSNTFPTYNPGGGAYYQGTKPTSGTNTDGGIMKFSPAGVRLWASYIGGTTGSSNSVTGVGADASGNVYAVGYTNTTNFTTMNETGSYNHAASNGANDLFYMKFNGSSVLQWSTYYGGAGDETCYGVKMATSSDACNFKQFNFFTTNNSGTIPTVNPGSPALYQTLAFTTNANACILFNTAVGSLSSAATSIGSSPTVSCSPGFTTTLSVSGGSLGAGANWQWYTASCGGTSAGSGTSISVSPSSATTYYVRAEGSCNTTACVSLLVTPPTPVTSSINSSTNVTCFGGNNGSATVTPGGGNGSYTYSWAPSGGTAATAGGLTTNTYTVTVTDGNSCSATSTISITQPTQLTASINTSADVLCFGSSTGSATVTAGGGTGSYGYAWAPSGGSAATAPALDANTYTVTVTDANSCTQTATITIAQPAQLTANINTSTNELCFGGSNGSATVTAGGGTGSYGYAWAPSGGNAATASGLDANTYTVTVTDANSCTQTSTITITQPTAITCNINIVNPPNPPDNNGVMNVNASGGTSIFTYNWSPSGGTAPTASNLAGSTVYTVTVTDQNGCTCTSTQTFGNVGIQNTEDVSFSLFPNPGEDAFQIQLSGNYTPGNVYIRIYDISGKAVLSQVLQGSLLYIDMTGYAPGIYMISIVSNEKIVTKKWIKQ